MNETLFAECVDDYCRGVGANSGVAEHLKANYRTLVIAWKITARDFGEVAFRFVSGKRIRTGRRSTARPSAANSTRSAARRCSRPTRGAGRTSARCATAKGS